MKKVKITSLDQQEFTLISVLSGRILKMKSTIDLFLRIFILKSKINKRTRNINLHIKFTFAATRKT